MRKAYVPQALRASVAAEARYRCGYCLVREVVVGVAMEIDHIVPESLGGPTEESNLWLACSSCNDRKNDRIAALDPESGEVVRVFDPRRQKWSEHFRWSASGELMIGRTPVGRATIVLLDLNRPLLVRSRRLWVLAGWHPPAEGA